MGTDKIKSSSALFLAPVVMWFITGYPLRQFLPEDPGLLVAGGGLSFTLYLLLLQLVLYGRMHSHLVTRKRVWVYATFWFLYLSWGLLSSLESSYRSLLYQLMLIAGVFAAFLLAMFRAVPLTSVFKAALWTTFPFTLLWWATWLKSGLVTDVTYRNPSYGVISLVALCSAAFLLRFPVSTIVESAILVSLFLNEHRATLLAGMVIISLQAVFYLRSHRGQWTIGRICMYIGLTSLILLGLFANVEKMSRFVLEDVLLWNDPHRGVSSGFSYRLLEWEESLRLFSERPVLGWGPRANEVLLQDLGPILASSTHNGVLANLVDYGLPGAALSIILMAWPIYLSARRAWMNVKNVKKEDVLSSTLAFSYIVLGMGERYWFNIGNPTSVTLLLSLFYIMANE